MEKVLVVVDETKTSESVLSVFENLVRPPEELILLHVERLEGMSLMIDMLGEAELSTLKESIKGTEYKQRLDRRAAEVLGYYKRKFESQGLISVRTVVKEGIVSDEIVRTAEEEGVGLVVIGCDVTKGLDRLIAGSLSRDVERSSRVPVILARKTDDKKEDGHKEPLVIKPVPIPEQI